MAGTLKSDERLLEQFPAGADFHMQVKIGLMLKQKSLSQWGREHEVHLGNIRLITHGLWSGKKGKQLRIELIKDAGLLEEAS